MKRTALLFAFAALLMLTALLVGLLPTKKTVHGTTVAPAPTPAPFVADGSGSLKLSASLSDPYLLEGGPRDAYLKVDLDAIRVGSPQRTPVNLAIVLDRSGSMAGEKIEQCRRAARHLVQQLDEGDRFALVTFGSDVSVLIPSQLATPSNKELMLAKIDRIAEMGGTNMSSGLEVGLAEVVPYQSQFRVTRVVLLSDGQANEGIYDPEGLAGIARRISGKGVTLSSIGVGLDFNEDVLQALADHGGGQYNFLADAEQLPKIFGSELQQALATVATGVSLEIAVPPEVSGAEVFGYLAEPWIADGTRFDKGWRVRLPDFTSGQHRKVVVRLIVPSAQAGGLELAKVSVVYNDVLRDRAAASARLAVTATVTADERLASAHRNREVAKVAAQANVLQQMRQANSFYQSGRRDEAQRAIQQAQVQLDKATADFGADEEFEAAKGEARAFQGALSAPAEAPAAKAAAKRMHNFNYLNR